MITAIPQASQIIEDAIPIGTVMSCNTVSGGNIMEATLTSLFWNSFGR